MCGIVRDASFWSAPEKHLDSKVWEPNALDNDDDRLKPAVRNKCIQLFKSHFSSKYSEPMVWGNLFVVGSATSYQWKADQSTKRVSDFDLNLVVDLDTFKKLNPQYALMESKDIHREMHLFSTDSGIDGSEIVPNMTMQIFVRDQDDLSTFLYYQRQSGQGIYSVFEDRWLVIPFRLDRNYDPMKAYQEWIPGAKRWVDKANDLVDSFNRNSTEGNRQVLKDFYNSLRARRTDAFIGGGGGQFGEGNFIWQWMNENGPMHEMKEIVGGWLLSSKESGVLASYRDVQSKAARIYQAGGINPLDLNKEFCQAEVRSESGQTYLTVLSFDSSLGGKIKDWVCECPWSMYSYDRAPEYKYLEHRKCAHALALLYYLQTFKNLIGPALDSPEA